MKKRLLSIIAALVLVLAFSIPLAVPVAAVAPPVLNAVSYTLGGLMNNPATSVEAAVSGINKTDLVDQVYTITFNGQNLSNLVASNPIKFYTSITGTLVLTSGRLQVNSITPVSNQQFTANITVFGNAPHGPLDVTVETTSGVSPVLYSGFVVGNFPHPVNGSSGFAPTLKACSDPQGTPIEGPVSVGQQIYYRVGLSQTDPTVYNFSSGQIVMRFPSWSRGSSPDYHVTHLVAGYGEATPGLGTWYQGGTFPAARDIPEIYPGYSDTRTNSSVDHKFFAMCIDPYIASAADLDAGGYLNAYAEYGATTVGGDQFSGVVEANCPLPLKGTIPSAVQMQGSLRVTKSVSIPNGVQLTGLNRTFTVTITGPGYNQTRTFTLTNGNISPNYYDLFGLTPGTYNVSETPGSPWVASVPNSGNVAVTSAGTSDNITVSNTFVPGSLTVAKVVNSGTGITRNFTVTVSGDNYTNILTFNMVNGIVTNTPQTLTNLVPGAYTVVETDPGTGWTFGVSAGGNVTVTSDGSATSTVTNNYAMPHTTMQPISAYPSVLPVGGGDILITVWDTNDGTVDVTSPQVALTGNPAIPGSTVIMTPVATNLGNLVTMSAGATWTFTATVHITQATTFTATGSGMANGVSVAGASETRILVVGSPGVPASSNLGLGLLILAFAGGITVFGWQRRRNSQKS
jgi:hypothetical protein